MLDNSFDFKNKEKDIYQKWENGGYFKCHPESEKEPFCVMMPPPNVTGVLHLGHAMNDGLIDILIRYHRMNGKDVLFQPGTDHAGIATQSVVEKKLIAEEGITRNELGREKFLEKVWEWKEHSGGTIQKQLRAVGVSADWSREKFTMDESVSKAVNKFFVHMYNEGLIYKGKRMINWDTQLGSAISNMEVETKDQKGFMWYINYPIVGSDEFITVATTRPETMLGDSAVAVHPENEKYKHLIGKEVKLPLTDRTIKIIADEYADPEKGTGAVKITPAHDFNDFEVGQRHDLELITVIDFDGKMNEEAGVYFGLDRFDAREKIVADLENGGFLVEKEKIVNAVPYGDRSKTIIEPMLSDQWFVDTKKMAEQSIDFIKSGEIEILPKYRENTLFYFLENIQPWCISRQLWWGHQIPVWYGIDGEKFCAESEAQANELAEKHYGKKVELVRDEDGLDTWFSSALWPFSTLGWPEKTPELTKYYPNNALITGFDIIFFWVARMMMAAKDLTGSKPFDKVFLHGLIRDEKGRKMSKSLGNGINPIDMIKKYGADALRMYLSSVTMPGADVNFSEKQLEGYRNFATKLWNAVKFTQMNDCRLDSAGPDGGPKDCKVKVNQWILQKLKNAQSELSKNFEEYRFNDATSCVYQFVRGDFCDWYIEMTKPIFAGSDEAAIKETKATTAYVRDCILMMLHPFMPFITEELWDATKDERTVRSDLLITQQWEKYDFDFKVIEIDWLIETIQTVRSARVEMNVPASAKIDMFIKVENEDMKNWINDNKDIIKKSVRLESLEIIDTERNEDGDFKVLLKDAVAVLPLGDVVDLKAEKARLEKSLQQKLGFISGLEGRLNNERFVANAPEEVIAEQRESLENAKVFVKKLQEIIENIK